MRKHLLRSVICINTACGEFLHSVNILKLLETVKIRQSYQLSN